MNVNNINSPLHLAASSLNVHSVGMQVTAHNIANVSTGDFEPQRATFVTGPAGSGVELESVRKIPANIKNSPSTIQDIGEGKNPSGTEIAKEFPHMISYERGFEANTAVIKTSQDMFAALLDMKI